MHHMFSRHCTVLLSSYISQCKRIQNGQQYTSAIPVKTKSTNNDSLIRLIFLRLFHHDLCTYYLPTNMGRSWETANSGLKTHLFHKSFSLQTVFTVWDCFHTFSSVANKDLTLKAKAKAKDLSLDLKDKFKDCSLLLQLQWRRQDFMQGEAQKLRKNNLRVAHKTIIIFM